MMMLKTYFKIAVRNFVKERFFSAINILGLSVGIGVALLITIYLVHELSFDKFHSKHERIYRIPLYMEVGGSGTELNATFPPMAEAIQTEIPEIDLAIRVSLFNGRIFKADDKVFSEDRVMYADSALFSVFDFKVLAGNPQTALAKPYQILLTPDLVKKYFNTGNYGQVIGNSILINQELYQITGVVEEPRANSHILYSAIASMESTAQGRDKTWDNMNVSSYILLKPNTVIETVLRKIPGVFNKYIPNYKNFSEHGIAITPLGQPITDIHLRSNIRGEFEPGGSMMNIYIFGSVAFVVLLLACVNFVNLLTARSANRAKEVGVRKVLGSSRSNLMRQFILECILFVAVSTLLALGSIELLRGPFTALIGKSLPFDELLTPDYLIFIGLFIILLGIIAGSYPAFYLSSFQPAQVLKGKIRSGFKSSKLRNSLVTMQFLISMILITCTLVMQKQLHFMRGKKLGFDKENVVIVDNTNRLAGQQAYIDAVLSLSGVESAGAATFRPVDDYDGMLVTTEEDKDNRKHVNFSLVDDQFLDVMKYTLVDGRNFSKDMASDTAAVVINEMAAKILYGGQAVGEKLYNDPFGYTVIGVVKDFNFESLKNEVRPVIFYRRPNQRFLHVRLKPGNYETTLAEMERLWKQQTSEIPFSFAFMDDTYNNLFKEEVKLGTIFSIFTALGLFIACLGLMGLTAYMAEQRKKEISIRKVLGANLVQVISMMSKEFVKIMILAFVLAVPVSWYMMTRWLEGFVYRTDIPVSMLIVGGGVVIFIALAAVAYQSLRAALLNPVDSLKEE
jgi:putative ABC transport system permease protein